ncbi:hypothetical protein IWX49DRAFT_419842 [Phyllosticta citricarpa]
MEAGKDQACTRGVCRIFGALHEGGMVVALICRCPPIVSHFISADGVFILFPFFLLFILGKLRGDRPNWIHKTRRVDRTYYRTGRMKRGVSLHFGVDSWRRRPAFDGP